MEFRMRVELFSKYCEEFGLIIPDFEESEDGSEHTSPSLVTMTDDADVTHVFGHYLCDYHTIEPDVVADVIKSLVNDYQRSF